MNTSIDTREKIFFAVLIIIIVTMIITSFLVKKGDSSNKVGEYDAFAMCLKDSGALFYGAFWCPHCQAQKKMFGSSSKLLPYVECSTLDGKGQLEECRGKDIKSYPTWEFKDGSRLNGEIPLEQLAEKTGCVLPEKK